MTKAELIKKLCNLENIPTQADAEKILTAVFAELGDALKEGGSITIPNFGTFSVKARKARKGRNPRTGDPIDIPATKVVHFSPSKGLKEAVAGK